MFVSFMSDIDSFSNCTMRSGADSWADTVRNMLRVTAITSEAGTPFPDTSPMQKNSFSSRI